MTTIIAAQGEKWAVVGYDSLVSDEGGRSFILGRGSSKVVKNGQYLFAPPKPNELIGTRLDKFVTSKFIPALRACFEDQGYAPRESKETAQHGSVVLVAVNGTIYEIDEDYSWVRGSTGIYTAGTGGDVALGAMHAMSNDRSFDEIGLDGTKKIIRECLAIAVKLDNQSGGPLHVAHQVSP